MITTRQPARRYPRKANAQSISHSRPLWKQSQGYLKKHRPLFSVAIAKWRKAHPAEAAEVDKRWREQKGKAA